MEQVGRDLPHPTPEQVRLIIFPFPLPVQQVSQGRHGKGLTPSLACHLSVRLIHSCLNVVIRCL